MEKRIRRHFPAFRWNPQDDLQSSARRRVGAHVLDLPVERGFGDFALLNVHHQPVVRADEADVQTLLELVPLAANHDAVPVAVRLRARNQRIHSLGPAAADPLEQINHLLVFQAKLRRVIHVLILAAATIAEIAARRLDALRRRPRYALQAGAGKIFLHLHDFRFHRLAHQHERHKYDKIIHARHAFAAERDVANGQSQLIANSQSHADRLETPRPPKKIIRPK